MEVYAKLPIDGLVAFYYEILKNIDKGILTNHMYYELGLIISAAKLRGLLLPKPRDFEQVVDRQVLSEYFYHTCKTQEIESIDFE